LKKAPKFSLFKLISESTYLDPGKNLSLNLYKKPLLIDFKTTAQNLIKRLGKLKK